MGRKPKTSEDNCEIGQRGLSGWWKHVVYDLDSLKQTKKRLKKRVKLSCDVFNTVTCVTIWCLSHRFTVDSVETLTCKVEGIASKTPLGFKAFIFKVTLEKDCA